MATVILEGLINQIEYSIEYKMYNIELLFMIIFMHSGVGNQYKVTVSFADPSIFADTAVGILYLTINGNEASIRRVQL